MLGVRATYKCWVYELLTSVGCTSYLQIVSGDGESDETEQPPENLQRKYNGSTTEVTATTMKTNSSVTVTTMAQVRPLRVTMTMRISF